MTNGEARLPERMAALGRSLLARGVAPSGNPSAWAGDALLATPTRSWLDAERIDGSGRLDALEASGFEGLVGCECRPRGRAEDGLGWFDRFRSPPRSP